MNQTMYVALGLACVIMVLAVVWRVSQGKSVVPGVRLVTPVLPPSQDQKVRNHVAPIFDDMIDKERAAEVAGRLFTAYKGDGSSDSVTGVGSQVKGGQSASVN